MRIGELAQMTGCSVSTIRFYEAEGLLQPASRTSGNYRDYRVEHADRLAFMLRCRSLGMSHEEMRALLVLQGSPDKPCDEVNSLLDIHTRLVEQRIKELTALRGQLRAIRSTCAGGMCIGDCGALGALRSTPGAMD